MHIFISGIGGTGVGPLAMVAKQAGYRVSGSDKQDSQYVQYLRKHGITNIHIGQSVEAIAKVHEADPIDWLVYSSAVPKENPDHPELLYAESQSIKHSKRDALINQIISDKKLKMIAIAGTHGKTTTTAMAVWLLSQLKVPVSYILPAKTSFAEMGHYHPDSKFFVYECDEFDRNFLAFQPYLSLITGVSWDHHEIFPTRDDYQEAFKEFITQSDHTVMWREDYDYLGITGTSRLDVLDSDHPKINDLTIAGRFNRLDAWLVIQAVNEATKIPVSKLLKPMNRFPGLQRRMEPLIPNLYSDYAHTPEKIRGGMSVALEMAAAANNGAGQKVVVIYEPLTNRRQHYMINDYKDCFAGADKVYWTPSYLAREDPDQRVIPPEELISHLDDPSIAQPADLDAKLKTQIQKHLDNGDMVLGMAGGGGGSLDEWLRQHFLPQKKA